MGNWIICESYCDNKKVHYLYLFIFPCAISGLARVELFLGLTATVQNFRILPRDSEPIDLEPLPLNILQPKKQYIRIEKLWEIKLAKQYNCENGSRAR